MPSKTFLRLDPSKQERVMRCAISEFHERGFDKANIGTVAENAEVAKGSIYQYFENKKELFQYSIEWTLNFFMTDIDSKTPVKNMDIYEYFLSGGRERAEVLQKEPLLVAFSMDVFYGKFAEIGTDAYAFMWEISDKYIIDLIKTSQQRGTVRTDIEMELLLLFFKGVSAEFEKHIFSKLVKDGTTLVCDKEFEDVFEETQRILVQMVALLKSGMGMGEC